MFSLTQIFFNCSSGIDALEPVKEWAWSCFSGIVFGIHHLYIMQPLALVNTGADNTVSLYVTFFFLCSDYQSQSEQYPVSSPKRPFQWTLLQTVGSISSGTLLAYDWENIFTNIISTNSKGSSEGHSQARLIFSYNYYFIYLLLLLLF